MLDGNTIVRSFVRSIDVRLFDVCSFDVRSFVYLFVRLFVRS